MPALILTAPRANLMGQTRMTAFGALGKAFDLF